MARIGTQLKLNQVTGPRLPYRPREAEIRENAYVYITADGIAIPDGEGILYWVDFIATSDAGGGRLYDNNAASGVTLSAAYAAKASDSVINNYDPPKRYTRGIYADVTTGIIEICYKPLARNLRCRVSIADTLTPLQAQVTVRREVDFTLEPTRDRGGLICRVECEREPTLGWEYTRALVSRITVRQVATRALVSKVTVQLTSYGRDLVCRVYADQTP